MPGNGPATTIGIVGLSLVVYAFLVAPPDPIAMGMLLFLTVPPAWALTALGRKLGGTRPLSSIPQGALAAAGFGMMWGAPWLSQAQLERHLDAGGVGSPGGLTMALPILGPLLWCLAIGWVMASRESAAAK